MTNVKTQKVDIRTGSYFPQGIVFTGVLVILLGVVSLIASQLLAGVLFIIIGIVLVTTHYRLEVNFNEKTYHDYVWFLGLKKGDKGQFHMLDYLFIKKIRQRQNLNSRISSKTITTEAYDGYLKFNGGETIHLFTKSSKTGILKSVNKIANALEVKVVDYSETN